MSRLNRYTKEARQALAYARQEAQRLRHRIVGTEHLLLGILRLGDPVIEGLFTSLHISTLRVMQAVEFVVGHGHRVYTSGPTLGSAVRMALANAEREAAEVQAELVGVEHLLLGLFSEPDGVTVGVLESFGVLPEVTRQQLHVLLREGRAKMVLSSQYRFSYEATPMLNQVSRDLTQAALAGRLDPVIGREAELERTMQILARRSKNNPALLGHAGVGKTAIVEGLAQRIIEGRVPENLLNYRVVALAVGLLPMNTRFRGDFEEHLKHIIQEILYAGDIILVIDELHTLVETGGAEGSMDAGNLFKPMLARGEFQCIGVTTVEEYRRKIETDAALERRFQPVYIAEATPEETLEMLLGLRARYAEFHQVTITDEAMVAAVQMSARYMPNHYQPDKAIDLLDEAAARASVQSVNAPEDIRRLRDEIVMVRRAKEYAIDHRDFTAALQHRAGELRLSSQLYEFERARIDSRGQQRPVVGEQEIAQVVAVRTGIPVMQITAAEAEHLLKLEETLHQRVIGQHAAVQAVARAVRRSRTDLRDKRRPIGSFIFVGPGGVGKTELARALAAALFGDERALITLDMSEFMESHQVARLIGAPPGYIGYDQAGQLTEAIYRRPYSVILFDDIEKAHPRIYDLLLQILDEGRLTDTHNKVVDFKHTLVILSSNVGASHLEQGSMAFTSQPRSEQERQAREIEHINAQVIPLLKRQFKPELFNRVDEVVPFHSLEPVHLRQIVDLMVASTQQRIQKQGITLQVTDEARNLLVKYGYNPAYGARLLRHTVQSMLEDMLAEAILQDTFVAGDTVVVNAADGRLEVKKLVAVKVSKGKPAA
ncbi:MAG: ATP-dependent Clp protease ATP-binding subunit [Ktedonobacteraceae bacterium]